MIAYDRLAPIGPCVSPDGHEYVEVFTMASRIPEEVFCPNCGKQWTIVTFEVEG